MLLGTFTMAFMLTENDVRWMDTSFIIRIIFNLIIIKDYNLNYVCANQFRVEFLNNNSELIGHSGVFGRLWALWQNLQCIFNVPHISVQSEDPINLFYLPRLVLLVHGPFQEPCNIFSGSIKSNLNSTCERTAVQMVSSHWQQRRAEDEWGLSVGFEDCRHEGALSS